MTYYTIYKITNKISGKFYIGMHKTSNLNDGYMGSGKYLKNAIKKYGIENFDKDYIAIFDDEERMINKEVEIVDEEFIKRKDTYNIGYGGIGSWKYCNKNKFNLYGKNGKAGYGFENLLNGNRVKELLIKRKRYDNWKNKISISNKKLYDDGFINPFKGKNHTKETKRKIGAKNSIKQKGNKNSQYGTCWIHNFELKENKKIKKEDLQYWVNKGWIKGRKMKF